MVLQNFNIMIITELPSTISTTLCQLWLYPLLYYSFSCFIKIKKNQQKANILVCTHRVASQKEPYGELGYLADETLNLFLSPSNLAFLTWKYFTSLVGCLTFISSRRKNTRLIMFRQAIVRHLTGRETNRSMWCQGSSHAYVKNTPLAISEY